MIFQDIISMKQKIKNVPIPVIKRMPYYLSFVKILQGNGDKYVSSTRIAQYMGIDSTQVTKDLSHTGITGKTRVGYEVDSFIDILTDFLGFNKVSKAFIVGVGSLGSSLLQDRGLAVFGLKIDEAFDIDVDKIGLKINDIEVHSLADLKLFASKNSVEIGIITTPASEAQKVADIMVDSGIKGIWNFTPSRIKVPNDIVVQNTTIYTNLAILYNKLSSSK